MSKLFRIVILLVMALSLPLTTAFAHNDRHHDSLVSLGDSIPFGFSPERNNEQPAKYAYPYLIGEKADVHVKNLAVSGAETDDLLAALKNNKHFRQSVKKADYVTVQIGGNDFLASLRAAYAESRGDTKLFHRLLEKKLAENDAFKNLHAIVKEIRSLTKAKVVLYNLYNPFHLNSPFHNVADLYLPELNAMYKDVANSHKNVKLADSYQAFGDNQAKYLIKGDIHPTKAGHEKLAKIGLKALSHKHVHHQHR